MGGLTLKYLVRRLGIFVFTVWLAATLIFIIPRMAPGDPIAGIVARMSQQSGNVENAGLIIEAWRERFGLNDPIHIQYLRYLRNLITFDFGPSLAGFPTTVKSMIGRALPWSLGLLSMCLLLIFLIGNLFGALLAWRRTPRLAKILIPISMMFTSVPPLLAGIMLIYVFAFGLDWLPLQGAFARGLTPEWSWKFASSVFHHGILPALSVIIVSFGYYAIGMRGMMVTIEGEDYITLAEAKGLNPLYILYRYMIRNAILPQITALALAIGGLVGGQVLVEVVFRYNGMGTLIFNAIRSQDFSVIQGASYVLILLTALAVLIVDLIYPLIDPRISHDRS